MVLEVYLAARRWFHFWQAISSPFPCALLLLWTISCGRHGIVLMAVSECRHICSTALCFTPSDIPYWILLDDGHNQMQPMIPFCFLFVINKNYAAFFLFVIYIELQRVFHDTRDRQREIPICCIFRVQKLCMSILFYITRDSTANGSKLKSYEVHRLQYLQELW